MLFVARLRAWVLAQLDIRPSIKMKKEVISMDAWIPFVREVGFPIVVTLYLLHRIEGKLDVLIDSIHALPDKMKIH